MFEYVNKDINTALKLFSYINRTYSTEVLKKLDLELNNDLVKKLNHFRNILIAANNKEISLINSVSGKVEHVENYKVISIETLTNDGKYEELDSDLHIRTDKDFYIDLTSDEKMLSEKAKKMAMKFGNDAYIYVYNNFYQFDGRQLLNYIIKPERSFKIAYWYSNLDNDYKEEVDTKLEDFYSMVKANIAYKSENVTLIENKHTEEEVALAMARCKTNSLTVSVAFLTFMSQNNPDYFKLIMRMIAKHKMCRKLKLFKFGAATTKCKLVHSVVSKLTNDSVEINKIYKLSDLSQAYIWPSHEYGYNLEHKETYFSKLENGNYKIILGSDMITANLTDLIQRKLNPAFTAKKYIKSSSTASISDVAYFRSEQDNTLSSSIKSLGPHNDKEIIWNKIDKIAELTVHPEIFEKGMSIYYNIFKIFSKTEVMHKISHYYEIAKTVAASFKASPKNHEYYLGKNGVYNSYTLVKRSSTQDSFKTVYFCVFYFDVNGKEISSEWYSFNKNSLSWALKLPFVVSSVLQYYLESARFELRGKYDEAFLTMANLVHLCMINSNPFSECSENLRYFVMSGLGTSSDFKSLIEKVDKFTPRTSFELNYMINTISLSYALSVVRDAHKLSELNIYDEMSLIMPHDYLLIPRFSYVVSSLYVCNLFNKKRAFHEYSEAVNYLNLIDEENIYSSVKDEVMHKLTSTDLNNFQKALEEEYENIKTFVLEDQVRFKGSPMFILATAVHFRRKNSVMIKHKKFYNSTLTSGCSMKGATEGGIAKLEKQGIRAASAIFEGIMNYHEVHNKIKTGNPNVIKEASETNSSIDVWSLLKIQAVDDNKRKYLYRIVQKDQKGHREISVLNFNMRVGTYAVEEVSRATNSFFSNNVLEDPRKDETVYKAIKSFAFEHVEHEDEEKRLKVFYDSNDQKRWGPNQLMEYFAILSAGLYSTEISNLLLTVFINMKHKVAKFPESLLDLLINKKHSFRDDTAMGKIEAVIKREVNKGYYGMNFEWGMCQGILHNFSSIYHAVKLSAEKEIAEMINCKAVNFCTSDDGIRIIKARNLRAALDYVEKCCKVDKLFNIIRNRSKSFVQTIIAEFNSVFYHAKSMAVPVLKFRAATIDCGTGEDSYDDMILAISSGTQHFLKGGSYVGTLHITVLALTIYAEQWRKFFLINNLGDEFKYLPCELGGLPLIEPLSILLNGPISACYFRIKKFHNCTINSYSNLIAMSLDNIPSWLPTYSHRMNDALDGFEVLVTPSLNGLYSIMRTKRSHSQFARRHKFKEWYGYEHLANIKQNSTSIGDFIFNFTKLYNANTARESLGENSYYIRFTEPWLSLERKVFKIAEFSIFNLFVKKTAMYLSQVEIDSEISNIFSNPIKKQLFNDYLEDLDYEPYANNSIIVKNLLMSTEELVGEILHKKYQETMIKKRPKFRPSNLRLIHFDSEDPGILKCEILSKFVSNASLEKMVEPRYYSVITSENDVDKLPLDKAAILAESITNNFFKFMRISTKVVTCSPIYSEDISSFVTYTLKYRFTENTGLSVDKLKVLEHMRHAKVKISKFYEDCAAALNKSRDKGIKEELTNDVHNYLVNILNVSYINGKYLIKFENMNKLNEIAKVLASYDAEVKIEHNVLEYLTNPYEYLGYPVLHSNSEFWSKATEKYIDVPTGIHMIKFDDKKEIYTHYIYAFAKREPKLIIDEPWSRILCKKLKDNMNFKRDKTVSGKYGRDHYLFKIFTNEFSNHDVSFEVAAENNFMFMSLGEIKIPLFTMGSVDYEVKNNETSIKVDKANYHAAVEALLTLKDDPELREKILSNAKHRLRLTDEDLSLLKLKKDKRHNKAFLKQFIHFLLLKNFTEPNDVNILAAPYVLNNNFAVPIEKSYPFYVNVRGETKYELESDDEQVVEVKENPAFEFNLDIDDEFSKLWADMAQNIEQYEGDYEDLDDSLKSALTEALESPDEEIRLTLKFKVTHFPNIKKAREFMTAIDNLLGENVRYGKNIRSINDYLLLSMYDDISKLSLKYFNRVVSPSLILFLNDFLAKY